MNVIQTTTAVRLEEIKTKILSILREKGPTLPVHLTSAVERDTMFVGAILSDLIGTKQVKVSHAKIGGSRIYYLPGQEAQLERLYDHLPIKEKEAYTLLKQKQQVKNSELDPSIRVALYNLKDFAVAYQRQNEWYWRWYLAEEQPIIIEQPRQQESQKKNEQIKQKEQPKRTKQQTLKPQPLQETEFSLAIEKFMLAKNIQLNTTDTARKNREYVYTVSVPSSLGTLPMLLVAKNKKIINETDLVLAHNLAQSKNLPAILFTTGTLTKKAVAHKEKHLKGLLLIHTA